MPDYVAYHSEAVMGRAYVPDGTHFTFVSSKPPAVLRRAIGERVWVISSQLLGGKTRYRLTGFYVPTEVEATAEGAEISGDGTSFDPAPELTALPWFAELRREQANFSLGFNPIRSATLVRDIERLLGQSDASIPARLPEEVSERVFLEGGAVRVTVNRYERDPEARAECLRIHGSACVACRVDLASVYGPIASELVHVHHITPISTVDRGYSVDPQTDLVPVCPNCHAVLHRRDPPLSPAELREMIERAQAG